MGRQRGVHSAAVSQKFVQGLDSKTHAAVTLANSTKNDSRKALFQSNCKNELHMTCCAVDSMNDSRKNPSRCRVCSKNLPRAPSKHEKRAYQMLDKMQLAYATEVFIFQPFHASVDFGFSLSRHPFDVLLVDYMLLIEIDGSQHFDERHHGKCCAEQQYRDAIMNSAVLEGGWGLVRLHYLDHENEWNDTIEAALEHRMETTGGFVHFSPYYSLESLP